jgi:glutamate decarboxylase
VPVIAFSLLNSSDHDKFEISNGLCRYSYTVPAYTMAPNLQHVMLLRVVVREDFSLSLTDRLVTDIKRTLAYFDARLSKLIEAVILRRGEEELRGAQPYGGGQVHYGLQDRGVSLEEEALWR